MLSELLRALGEPAPRSLPEIAAGLGVTPDRVRLALEQCERMGYLDRGDDACAPSACGSCPVECGMAPATGRRGLPVATAPRWWRLTERGRRAAGMAPSPG